MDFWNWILSSIEIIPLSIGLIIAVVSICSYRKTEKLKATLNITLHIITSPLANEGVDILRFIKHKDNDETGELLARDYIDANKISIDKLDRDSPTNKRIGYARKLCAYLNLLEAMCVGIDKGIYDENTCKDVLYSKVIYSWKNAKVFIEESRDRGDSKKKIEESRDRGDSKKKIEESRDRGDSKKKIEESRDRGDSKKKIEESRDRGDSKKKLDTLIKN